MDSQSAFEGVRTLLAEYQLLHERFSTPLAWLAPERMRPISAVAASASSSTDESKSELTPSSSGILTSAGDIWSLGLVLLELFAGAQISKDDKSSIPPDIVPLSMRVPWYGMAPSAIYQAAVVDSEVPPQLESPMPPELHTLIANCLSSQPGARPTASEVLSALLALSKLYPALEANDREAYHRYQVEVTSSGVSLERTMALLQLTGDTAQEFATEIGRAHV